jgi:hypothetical protein
VVLAALAMGALPTSQAAANVNLAFPAESPGAPFYARITIPVSDDGQWVPIVFYRDSGCVPPDFNLLAFFDIPRVFGCPLTVEGVEIWERGPGLDPAPIQVNSAGLGAVPVWFVSPADLHAVMSDDVLTIGELRALPSLQIATARGYREVLHPTEAANNGKITITATGAVADGRAFRLQVVGSHDTYRQVTVNFG